MKYIDLAKRVKKQKRTENQTRFFRAVAWTSVLVLVLSLTSPTTVAGQEEEEETLGSITVCKIILDDEGSITDGSEQPGTIFTIPGFTPSPETSEGAPAGEIPDSVFTTPITLTEDIIDNGQDEEAECVTYDELELGGYYYDEETISDPENWETPKYNDQFLTQINSLLDFFFYSGELYDGDGGNDGERNKDADGHIVLNEGRPDRVLVVLNQLVEQEDEVDLEVQKEVDEDLVDSGDTVIFTITLTNLGPDDAFDVVLDDLLPAGFTFVSASESQGSYDENTGEWDVGDLDSGESATLELTVTVSGEPEETITNIAGVDYEFDPNSENDSDDADVTINSEEEEEEEEEEEQQNGNGGGGGGGGGSSSSAATSGGGGGGPSYNGSIDFGAVLQKTVGVNADESITLTNTGFSVIPASTLTVTFPQELAVSSTSPAADSVTNNVVTWSVPAISPSDTFTVNFTVVSNVPVSDIVTQASWSVSDSQLAFNSVVEDVSGVLGETVEAPQQPQPEPGPEPDVAGEQLPRTGVTPGVAAAAAVLGGALIYLLNRREEELAA